jgi:cell division transport system permease protein
MKKSEWKYALKAGFVGLGRHPMLALVAISTLAIMLFLMSAFVAISLNARKFSEIAAKQPPIEVSLKIGVSDHDLETVQTFVDTHEKVQEYKMLTPEENYAYFVESMGKEDLWDGFDYEAYIPYTFNIRLNDPDYAESFKTELEQLPGIREVLMETQVMTALKKIERWTGRISMIASIILAVIVTLVMMNTVRVSVLSRSREINIMKYVGATNNYIRVPYIVEGATIGFIGALIASFAVALLYNYIVERFSRSTIIASSAFSFISASQMTGIIFVINIITGILLCVLISAISVRKYARV